MATGRCKTPHLLFEYLKGLLNALNHVGPRLGCDVDCTPVDVTLPGEGCSDRSCQSLLLQVLDTLRLVVQLAGETSCWLLWSTRAIADSGRLCHLDLDFLQPLRSPRS